MLCFCTYALALAVSRYWLEIFDLEKLGQVQRVQHRNDTIRWQMLKSINAISCSFALAFTVLKILTFEVWSWKSRSRSKSIIFAMMPIDSKYWNLQMSSLGICTSSHHFWDIDILNIWPWKVGQGHRVQHWQCRRQIANIKIYKHQFLHVWFSPRFDLFSRLSQAHKQSYMTWPWLIGKSTHSPKNAKTLTLTMKLKIKE